ncbi:cell wall-binding repeat-containing protein [Herbiconiux sp. SALV-R1]|uniref:cell wall-binding repeat-containing protein n=1 Tax=Herbiconiux sp. SALV-R1 TaxID=2735133 RepID=UPI001C1205D6|nr:cell wall-binding repeat-containing protein [Herbiconiux sp. SALV-R1]
MKVSEGAFAEGAGTVYLAAGANYPDALSGAPAAGEAGGPVLLTEKDRVPASVQAEIDRLSPERVVILGGTNSVSTGVEAAVAAEGRTVERIGGTDRYEVSAAVAADSFGSATTVYVASGEKAPDALSGAAAAGKDSPVLLTKKDELPQTVRDEIVALGPEKIIILGGTETIGETVALELAEIADTVRVSGADRYETSAAVADEAFVENTGGAVYIASGETFPDALTGSAAAIAAGAPVLLVQKDSIPIDIGETLERLGPSAVYVLGGPDTVSDTVVEILGSYVHDIDD